MSKILNILNVGKKQQSESSEKQVSTSMENLIVGVCPRCQKSMSSALILNDEDVFYCESCRIAMPKPNTQ